MSFLDKKEPLYNGLTAQIKKYIKKIYDQVDDVFTTASPFGQILDVFTKLTQMNLYYIEDSIQELNINQAQRLNSIYGLARLAGHNPERATAASGEVNIRYNGKIPDDIVGSYCIIPNFINLKCEQNGLTYIGITGLDDLKINIYNDRGLKPMSIIQGKFETQSFTGTDLPLQSFEANQVNKNMVDQNHIYVYVNGEKWSKYESLLDIPKDMKGYIVKTGITSGIDIYFGNNNHGVIPNLGANITVQYLLTDGFMGNLDNIDNISFQFDGDGYDVDENIIDLNDLFTIQAETPITFGSSSEDVQLTKLIAPLQSNSFVLAQTANYRSYFEKMQRFSRINVWTETDKFDPYIDLVLFALLIPDLSKTYRAGEDYFSTKFANFAVSDYEKYKIQNQIEQSGHMIMGSVLHLEDPLFKRYMINIYLNIFKGYDKQKIQDSIKIKLSEYLTKFRRNDYLPKSDLIAIIESIEGVDSVSLEFIAEEVENELRLLTDYNNYLTTNIDLSSEDWEKLERFHEGYSWYENNTAVFGVDSFVQNDLNMPSSINDLNINTKLKYILSLPSIQTYLKKYIDYSGDVILENNEIPLFRGGWYDRYGRLVHDEIQMNQLGNVNTFFKRETSDYLDYYQNKLTVSTLRNEIKG